MPAAATQTRARRATSTRSTSTETYGGISSDAVKKATGREWKEWFAILDKAGYAKASHKDIVAALDRKHSNIGGWWMQMITVGYEQARGLRARHQTPGGFQISASKTIGAPAYKVYMAWTMKKCLKQWLDGADVAVHKATPHKSVRATWNASSAKPIKSISVNIYPRGEDRAMVQLQHDKLASAAEAKKMKTYWGKQLEGLRALLEG